MKQTIPSARSLIIKTETQRTRMDGQLPEVDRLYLQIKGSPEAFRWLAALLVEKAEAGLGSFITGPPGLPQAVPRYEFSTSYLSGTVTPSRRLLSQMVFLCGTFFL